MVKSRKFNWNRFFDELFLNSGQYALFYLIVNFSLVKLNFFTNFNYLILIVSLIVQTYLMTIYGKNIRERIPISFLTLIVFVLLQIWNFNDAFIYNTAHIFFWVFTILIVLLQYGLFKTKDLIKKYIFEFILTFTNIFIFIFLYFYIDLKLLLQKELVAGIIDNAQYIEQLELEFLFTNFKLFLADAAHIYIIICGIILALTIAKNKVKVLKLKDRINTIFGRFVDVRIRDEILSKKEGYSRRRNSVILFSDIRSFTPIAEKNSPKKVIEMLKFYFTQWNEVIRQHNGIIKQYAGDEIMVIFTGTSRKIITSNAVKVSLKILYSINHLNEELELRKLPQIKKGIGIGINYGPVVTGNIGDKDRQEFGVVGDTVNIAARLESLCKTLKTKMVISESVYNNLSTNLKKIFEMHKEKILVKGKNKKLQIYKLKDLK